MRALNVLLALIALSSLTACAQARTGRRGPCCEAPAAKPAPRPPEPRAEPASEPATPATVAFLRGGQETTTRAAVLAQAARADVVLFGEIHGHPIGAELELETLRYLHGTGRPVALAMEFFEQDVQADLDAYLAGDIDEHTFLVRTRQGRAYATSHRPLVEFCKANRLSLIAANAPRRLVTAYRKQDASYADYRAGLSAAEQAMLPRETSVPKDAYYARFQKLMGPKRGPAFFRSQALWDDAMSEAVADFRAANPKHVVLLVIGTFHVLDGGGTRTKFQRRRPGDRVLTLAMSGGLREGKAASHKGAADFVILVP